MGMFCPKCRRWFTEPPALSREDNKTEICPDCGLAEAMKAFTEYCQNMEEDNAEVHAD